MENVKSVYMIIGNNEYRNFRLRFLEMKKYSGEENDNKEFKKLLPSESKELLFCGFVDFNQGINSNRGLNIKLEMQKKDMEKQKEEIEVKLLKQKSEMEKQKKEMEDRLLKEMEKQKKEMEDRLLNQKSEMEKQRNEFMEQIKFLKEEMKKQGEKIKNSSSEKKNSQKEQEE